MPIIYHATRRWQLELVNSKIEPTNSEKLRTSNKATRYLVSKIKNNPLLPPLSIFHTVNMLRKRAEISFAPSLPICRSMTVYLENYDSLYDYNSVKRKIFTPLVLFMILLCRGRFIYYSEKSKSSIPRFCANLPIFRRSHVEEDIFTRENNRLERKSTKKRQIILVGDFFLKGHLEFIEAYEKTLTNFQILFVGKDVVPYRKYLKKYDNFRFLQFDETDPSSYYEELASSEILCHPTFYDSHAIVVKEAKLCGLTVWATDIFDSATGADVIFSPSDDPFHNNRIKFPYSGQHFIHKYSSPTRKSDVALVKQLIIALERINDD